MRVGSIVEYVGYRWSDEQHLRTCGLVTNLEWYSDDDQETLLADVTWSDGTYDERVIVGCLELVSD